MPKKTGPTQPDGLSPRVSVIMPVRDEAAFIERGLDAIDAQTYAADRIEIIVVDGGSTDATLSIVRARAERDPRIQLLGGPGTNTPLAMNIGLAAATGTVVAKVDGHGRVNPSFLAVAVEALTSNPQLGCVGGRIVPEAVSLMGRAIAYARFSVLGVGSGVYTLDERPQLTDTVQCGVYRRDALEGAGAFDPDLPYGEDEEANHRIRAAGWQILMDPRMRFTYRVRPDASSLFRQYFRYGRARVAVVRKHPEFFRPKHALPGLVVIAMGILIPLTLLGRFRGFLAIPLLGYLGVLSIGAVVLTLKHRFPRPDLIAVSLAALHVGYGLGTLRGLADLLLRQRQ